MILPNRWVHSLCQIVKVFTTLSRAKWTTLYWMNHCISKWVTQVSSWVTPYFESTFTTTSYWITLSLRRSNSASEFCWVSDECFIQSSVCRPRPATFKGEFIKMTFDVLQTRSRSKNQTIPICVHSPGDGSRWSRKTKSAVSIYRNHFAGMANLNV